MLLSVITLTVAGREESLAKLQAEVAKQIGHRPFVEHLIVPGPSTYGLKMRMSLELAKGDYVCWLDDDDWLSPDYVGDIVDAISSHRPDVVTFGSDMVGYRRMWFRANADDQAGDYAGGQVWAANHYCAWRRVIALDSPWLPRNYGSETAWYKLLSLAYPNLAEVHIPKLLHTYLYDPKSTLCQNAKAIDDSMLHDNDVVTFVRLNEAVRGYYFGIAVGRSQPSGGMFFVTLPDYNTVIKHHTHLKILGKHTYE